MTPTLDMDSSGSGSSFPSCTWDALTGEVLLHMEGCLLAGIACSPCVSAVNNRQSACTNNVCMQRISIEQVFDAVLASYHERDAIRRRESETALEEGFSNASPAIRETALPVSA